MHLSVFKPFFSFVEPLWSSAFTYGATHFYNQARAIIDWHSYNLIKTASEQQGAVFLGQMPVKSFRDALVKKLAGNGLVVSCNDQFELAGIGAFSNIIPPHSWTYYTVDHQHLPFTDYDSNAAPSLIIVTLQKMIEVHNKGGAIYIHCKAGRSRSALIAALFLCISDEGNKKKLLHSEGDQQVEELLRAKIVQLKSERAQVSVDNAKIGLGVRVLKQYIKYWHGAHSSPYKFTLFSYDDNKLTAYQALNTIAQSDEYKFVWDQAYRNTSIFPTVKTFAAGIYNYVEKHEGQLFDIDQLIRFVLQDMDENEIQIIKNLHDTYVVKEEYIKLIKKYSTTIQNFGLELLHEILKSDLSYSEKTAWLAKTNAFLERPVSERLAQYKKEIQPALTHPSRTLQAIGGVMMLLGAAVMLVSVVGAFLIGGGFSSIVLGSFGVAAFGGFQCVIGKMIYDHGASGAMSRTTHDFLNKIMEDDCNNEASHSLSA